MLGHAEPFEYVHLSGERFKNGMLPVAAVAELSRYQRLLMDVAKHLFLAENPGRKRASLKSLDLASEDLLITGLKDGSTGVDLAVRRAEALIPQPAAYLERSRALIEEAFSSLTEDGELSASFPEELIPQLAMMGQNIPAGETYTWAKSSGLWESSRARLTRDTTVPIRKDLDDAEPVERLLHVFVVGVCSDPLTFDYKNSTGGKTLEGKYGDAELFGVLKENAEIASRAPLVALTVMADPATDDVVDVIGVEQVLPSEWSQRLDELSALTDGWLDGSGKSVSKPAMRAAETLLFLVADEALPRPGIFPTEEGGLHLEWDDAKDSEIVVDPSGVILLFSDELDDEGVGGDPEAVVTKLTRCLSV